MITFYTKVWIFWRLSLTLKKNHVLIYYNYIKTNAMFKWKYIVDGIENRMSARRYFFLTSILNSHTVSLAPSSSTHTDSE